MNQDLCDEERHFAEELRGYFDIEAEDLPPYYVEAMLGASEENLVERVTRRTYAGLGLQHERAPAHQSRIRLLNEWMKLQSLGPRRYPAIAASLLIVLVLVVFVTQRSEVYAEKPPKVLRTYPVDGARGVPADAPILIFLDRAISPSTRYVVTLVPEQRARVSAQADVIIIEPSGMVHSTVPLKVVQVHVTF